MDGLAGDLDAIVVDEEPVDVPEAQAAVNADGCAVFAAYVCAAPCWAGLVAHRDGGALFVAPRNADVSGVAGLPHIEIECRLVNYDRRDEPLDVVGQAYRVDIAADL